MRLLSIGSLLLLLAACGSDLHDGDYVFERTAVNRQDCALDPPIPPSWAGTVELRGETITLELDDPAFHEATGARSLIGFILLDGSRDLFVADSTFDVPAGVDGMTCQVFVHIRLEARLEGRDRFEANLVMTYDRDLEAAPGCPPACVTDLNVEAHRR